jgi:hypothetical protein
MSRTSFVGRLRDQVVRPLIHSALVNARWRLGSDFEDWVCETSFAWGEERHARVPEVRDLPEWLITGA